MGLVGYIVGNVGYVVKDRVKKVDFVHSEKLLLSVNVAVCEVIPPIMEDFK
tara:strand:+ start:165 stop:317 length:153 start_codon:yes stop_codon:yes gene_type:complete